MKTVVFGGSGMLGQDLDALSSTDHQVVCLSHQQADITKASEISQALETHQPDAVILAAAWTDVDGAQEHQEACRLVNVQGPQTVGEAAAKKSIPVVLVSSDYVFSRLGPQPHQEDEPHQPLNVYGQSKSDGEKALAQTGAPWAVVRTSWLFGVHGKNFCQTMMQLATKHKSLAVVDDQIGAPTWTFHLAQGLLQVVAKKLRGSLHLAASGQASWYTLTRELFQQAGLEVEVRACTSEEFPRPAKRPLWSVLEQTRTQQAGIVLPDWREGVQGWLKATGYVRKDEIKSEKF